MKKTSVDFIITNEKLSGQIFDSDEYVLSGLWMKSTLWSLWRSAAALEKELAANSLDFRQEESV